SQMRCSPKASSFQYHPISLPRRKRTTSRFSARPGCSRVAGFRRNAVRKQHPLPGKEIQVQIQPYLFFDGRCEEALAFYKKALGAEILMMLYYKDSPEPTMIPPNAGNKVMHARARIGNSDVLASDGRCEGKAAFDGFALSLTVASEAEADRCFTALSEGGK